MVRSSTAIVLVVLLVFVVSAVGVGNNYFKNDVSLSPAQKIDPGVSQAFEGLEEGAQVEVLINVKESGKLSLRDKRRVENLLAKLPEDRVVDYYYGGIIASLSENEIKAVAKQRDVLSIVKNVYFETTLEDSVGIIHATDTWQIQVNGQPLDGSGQSVCVVDTGIDFTHPDLVAKNIVGNNINCYDGQPWDPCFVDPSITDLNGHGTLVSGIVGAAGGINGIAKGVDLIALKVFPGNALSGGDPIAVRKAIEWCIDHKETYDISVISLSLGDGAEHVGYCDGYIVTVTNGVNNAVAENIAVVVSTGNEGFRNGISHPACIFNSIPVGATDKSDNLASYSNYDELMVKLFAPGGISGGAIHSTCASGGYCYGIGTSYSTPMVSASIAMINQFLTLTGQPYSMHPLDIEQLLFDTADPITGLDPGSWRRINVYNATMALDSEDPTVTLMSPANNAALSLTTSNEGYYTFACDADDNFMVKDITFEIRNSLGNVVYSDFRDFSESVVSAEFYVPYSVLAPPRGVGDSAFTGWAEKKYSWNCLANDVLGNNAWAPQDYNVIIKELVKK